MTQSERLSRDAGPTQPQEQAQPLIQAQSRDAARPQPQPQAPESAAGASASVSTSTSVSASASRKVARAERRHAKAQRRVEKTGLKLADTRAKARDEAGAQAAKAERKEAKRAAKAAAKHEREQRRARRGSKQLISADGTPYTVWQRRTRVLCILLLIYASVEVASGIVFVCLGYGAGFWLDDVSGGLAVRLYTLLFGVYNLIIALLGLRGAKDPKKVTLFFWAVLVNVVLMSWQVASDLSLGVYEISSIITFVGMFAFAVCAWKLREQTGYFDNHPMPEDD